MWHWIVFLAVLALPVSVVVADEADQTITINELRPKSWDEWTQVSGKDILTIKDDDIQRHAGDLNYFAGIQIDERYIRENGFVWHLLRFTNIANPVGPLWMVPHDDENAAFEGGIAALRQYGGVAVVVNSGPGSERRQSGKGTCGVRKEVFTSCDPNRNYAASSPKFTSAFLSQRAAGQPVIATHTNSHGFSGDGQGGRGEITILDKTAFQRGETRPRPDGHFAINPTADMANYDTLALTAYLASKGWPAADAIMCRNAMINAGVHFWHERVGSSDGSMSNYLVLNHPDVAYLNAESRLETDLVLASSRHKVMVNAYLDGCNLGDKPAP